MSNESGARSLTSTEYVAWIQREQAARRLGPLPPKMAAALQAAVRAEQCLCDFGCDERSHSLPCNNAYYAAGGTTDAD